MKLRYSSGLFAAGALWVHTASAQLDYSHHAEPVTDSLTIEETADLVSFALETSAQPSLKGHVLAPYNCPS